jgi:serine/threonine protein kinase
MENPLDDEEELQRRALAERCIRNGDARYAIKTLGDHTRSDAINYMKGVMDLAIEAKFLAVVRHSNIIRMRAVADCSPYDDGYFLVLDRLYGTLDDRLSQWEKEEAKAKGLVSKMSGKSKKKIKESITKRMVAAYDISRAMMHFHKNNIIYRDLKPENIGFDIRNDVKIFDLGLAKEIHEEERLPDGTYNLTGLTGSLRYMVSTFPP